MSKSVADLLQFYRTQDKDKELAERFRDTEGTEDFLRLINDTFDIMNGRCKKYGISRADWEGKKTVSKPNNLVFEFLLNNMSMLQSIPASQRAIETYR